jgi:hypothetical protein
VEPWLLVIVGAALLVIGIALSFRSMRRASTAMGELLAAFVGEPVGLAKDPRVDRLGVLDKRVSLFAKTRRPCTAGTSARRMPDTAKRSRTVTRAS